MYNIYNDFLQEFLKKEFSAENLYFWSVCEQYRSTIDQELRCAIARDIYAKHLACDAIEPVNVDSKASNLTIEQIEQADPSLFLQVNLLYFIIIIVLIFAVLYSLGTKTSI